MVFRLFIFLYTLLLPFVLPLKLFDLDVQGHRGCRGYMPENSIPGFLKAIDMGVHTLEMDVVISADSQVVVSHDPFFMNSICLTPDGKTISSGDQHLYNIYQMTYEQIKTFDCGSAGNKLFPEQQKVRTVKPLLKEVFISCEKYTHEKDLKPIKYNIEIKRKTEHDHVYHPGARQFCDLVMKVIKDAKMDGRVYIQSFDIETLRILKTYYPGFKIAYLVNNPNSLSENLESLGFYPDIYSPNYITVDKQVVESCHDLGIQIIPWTVNHIEHIVKLIHSGVDGIITDYPDRVLSQIP